LVLRARPRPVPQRRALAARQFEHVANRLTASEAKGDGAIPLEELFNVVASYVALVVEVGAVVVVIIGGMGSLAGAAVGSVLYGLVFAFAVAYLPLAGNDCCQQYSVVLTFALMALVLAFRPQGLFGRAA